MTAGFEEPDFALIAGIAELCMVVIFANPERKAKDSELTSRDQRYGLARPLPRDPSAESRDLSFGGYPSGGHRFQQEHFSSSVHYLFDDPPKIATCKRVSMTLYFLQRSFNDIVLQFKSVRYCPKECQTRD